MAFYYLDASALVKSYHTEPGSIWVRQIVAARSENNLPAHRIYIAEITIAECAAAFSILTRTNKISRQVRDANYKELVRDVLKTYRTIRVIRDDIDRAADLTQKHPLKGYDAIQLAVASRLKGLLSESEVAPVFVCADSTLVQAAQAEGLAVENPSDHNE